MWKDGIDKAKRGKKGRVKKKEKKLCDSWLNLSGLAIFSPLDDRYGRPSV